MITLDSD